MFAVYTFPHFYCLQRCFREDNNCYQVNEHNTAFLAVLGNSGNKFLWPTGYGISLLTRIQALLRICHTCFTYPAMINTSDFTIHKKQDLLRGWTFCNKWTSQPFASKLPSSVSYPNCKSFVIGMKQCTKIWNECTVVKRKKKRGWTGTYKFKTRLSMATYPNIALFLDFGFSLFPFPPLELNRWIHRLYMQIDPMHIIQYCY